MTPPSYTFDRDRLASLDAYDILDTLPEQGFDDIVNLAALVCETPVALVSFVAKDRQWFKARIGFEPCETDLQSSVCAHALVEPDLLVIEDLSADPRTRRNPLVTGAPHIRFYAGAPLRTAGGAVLGSLCVIDGTARPGGLTAAQAEGLRNLARQVMSQLDLRRALSDREALLAESRRGERLRNALIAIGERLRALNSVPLATRAVSEIVGQTLGLVRVGFARIDPSREYLDVEADWTADGFDSMSGRVPLANYPDLRANLCSADDLVVEDVATDLRVAEVRDGLLARGARALAKLAAVDQAGVVSLLFAHSGQPRVWLAEELVFLNNVGDRLAASVARTEAESLQRVLNLELSHRMKNTLAMVQAIARQTLRSAGDGQVEAFTSRLQALATAHEVLLQQDWASAKMSEAVRSVLETLQNPERFTLEGQEVVIGPRAVLSMSLILHELSTNALKYGAWSQPSGHVRVAWVVEGGVVHLRWREANGPAPLDAKRKGFGSKLINLGLVGSGGVTLRYPATGFEADFEAPLTEMQRGSGDSAE